MKTKINKNDNSTKIGDAGMGEQLASIRLRAGLTQTELADRINVSRQHISNMEAGLTSPTLRVLSDFVERCGLSLAQFFYGPLPTDQTAKQREYHRKLQIILEDPSTSAAIKKILDSFITSIEASSRSSVQPVRVQSRQSR